MKKRIFMAIDLPEKVRGEIGEYIENLRRDFPKIRIGWEKPEKLHLTLKFFGEIDEKQLAALEDVVLKVSEKISGFSFQINGSGVFPNLRNPRILWLGIEDEKGSLKEINSLLERGCEKIGFPKEKRSFNPHLTIARLREPQKSRDLAQKHLMEKFKPVVVNVSEIVIYESKLTTTGSVYAIIAKYPVSV